MSNQFWYLIWCVTLPLSWHVSFELCAALGHVSAKLNPGVARARFCCMWRFFCAALPELIAVLSLCCFIARAHFRAARAELVLRELSLVLLELISMSYIADLDKPISTSCPGVCHCHRVGACLGLFSTS